MSNWLRFPMLQGELQSAVDDTWRALVTLTTLVFSDLTNAGARFSRILLRVMGACVAAGCALVACVVVAAGLYGLLYIAIVPTKLHSFPLHFVAQRYALE